MLHEVVCHFSMSSADKLHCLRLQYFLFRGVRKIAEKRLLTSSCLSVRPHGTTRLPLDGFS